MEHHQDLLPGDALLRGETPIPHAGRHPLDIAPPHEGGVPASVGHIGEGGVGRVQLPFRGARQAVKHRHQHGPVHGGPRTEAVGAHPGEQAVPVHILHRGLEPVPLGHIHKRHWVPSARLIAVAPLEPQIHRPGAHRDHGGGVLPRQIAVPRRQLAPGGDLHPLGHVDERAAVDHLSRPGHGQHSGAGGQGQSIPLVEGAAAQVGAVQAAAPAALPLTLGQGLVIGGLEGAVHPLLHLGLGLGQEDLIQLTQGDQAVPAAEGQGPAAEDRRQDAAAEQQSCCFPSHVCSSPSSPSSRWEII